MATATTTGIWTGIDKTVNHLNGLNTKCISWGKAGSPQGQSGYVFDGISSVTVPTDGSEFTLGTFTHLNHPISDIGSPQFTASLKLSLSLGQGGPSQEFNFAFAHTETPNNSDHPDDLVSLPNLRSEETVTIEGKTYALQISGFKQGGKLVTQFDSPEDRDNSADIIAKLVMAEPVQPVVPPGRDDSGLPPEPVDPQQPVVPEGSCRVKNVVDTGALFGLALERLNRRSVVYLLEQLIAAVNAQCEKFASRLEESPSPVEIEKIRNEMQIAIDDLRRSSQSATAEANTIKQQIGNLVATLPQTIHQTIQSVNIQQVTNQIDMLNSRLIIIQKAAEELGDTELTQVQTLLINLLRNIDFGDVVRNIRIAIGGYSVDLSRLLEVLATADRVASMQIRYADPDSWEIAGARFVMVDSTQVVFNARILPDPTGLRVIYLFETGDWKGLAAQFKFVFVARKTSYSICGNRFNVDSFDGVEQTNVVFDLCPQFSEPMKLISPAPVQS